MTEVPKQPPLRLVEGRTQQTRNEENFNIRADRTRSFCTYDRAVMAMPKLSFGAKTTYCHLTGFLNSDGSEVTVFPSIAAIGKAIGRSDQQASRYVQELVDWKMLISLPRRKADGTNSSNLYKFRPPSQWTDPHSRGEDEPHLKDEVPYTLKDEVRTSPHKRGAIKTRSSSSKKRNTKTTTTTTRRSADPPEVVVVVVDSPPEGPAGRAEKRELDIPTKVQNLWDQHVASLYDNDPAQAQRLNRKLISAAEEAISVWGYNEVLLNIVRCARSSWFTDVDHPHRKTFGSLMKNEGQAFNNLRAYDPVLSELQFSGSKTPAVSPIDSPVTESPEPPPSSAHPPPSISDAFAAALRTLKETLRNEKLRVRADLMQQYPGQSREDFNALVAVAIAQDEACAAAKAALDHFTRSQGVEL